MKRFLSIVLVLLYVISLFGCSKDTSDEALYNHPVDVSSITDFKCVCSTDHKTEFVIENETAKALYAYITDAWQKVQEAEIDGNEQDYIYLSFQDGEPLLVLNQQPKVEICDALQVSGEQFYGVFWVYENDYLTFTASPVTSFQEYYKLPGGSYDKILKMVSNESKTN